MVTIVRDNRIELWQSRSMAIDFYIQGMQECDGCESERYAQICADLLSGKVVCSDGMSDSVSKLRAENRYYNPGTPDGTRDFGGKVNFQKLS